MNAVTINLSDETHRHLQNVALRRGVDISDLISDMARAIIVEDDAEQRFQLRAERGRTQIHEARALLRR